MKGTLKLLESGWYVTGDDKKLIPIFPLKGKSDNKYHSINLLDGKKIDFDIVKNPNYSWHNNEPEVYAKITKSSDPVDENESKVKSTMKLIYKYQLAMQEVQEVELPMNSKILSVQFQGEYLYLWALVNKNPGLSVHKHVIEIYGTGQEINYDFGVRRSHLATVQSQGFVWHVFEHLGF